MDPGTATETGNTVLTWLTDYGALQVLALFGLAWPVVIIVLFAWTIVRVGRPIGRIADALEKLNKGGDEP